MRTILALETIMKWKIHHMDVKTTFLNVLFKEEVYIENHWDSRHMTGRPMCVN